MNSQSLAQFRIAVESAFGPYLSSHSFIELAAPGTGRVKTLVYQSPELLLSFFFERSHDFYAKVGAPSEPASSFYLSAALAFLTGTSEPILEIKSVSRLLPERHNEVVSLFSANGHEKREKLQAWIQAYAQRAAGVLQENAREAKSKRRWWQFGA